MKNSGTLEAKIDLLASQVKVGFDTLSQDINDLAITTKNSFDEVFERFEQVDRRFEQIDSRLDAMDRRFDRIENVSIGGHERRIENLEDDVRILKTKTGLKK